jgi:hypothetical protein
MKALMLLWVACESIAPVNDDTSRASLPSGPEYFDLETFEVWDVTDIYLLTHSTPRLDVSEMDWCRHFFLIVDSLDWDTCPVCSSLEEDVRED